MYQVLVIACLFSFNLIGRGILSNTSVRTEIEDSFKMQYDITTSFVSKNNVIDTIKICNCSKAKTSQHDPFRSQLGPKLIDNN